MSEVAVQLKAFPNFELLGHSKKGQDANIVNVVLGFLLSPEVSDISPAVSDINISYLKCS